MDIKKQKITGAKRGKNIKIDMFMLEDKRWISLEEAILLIEKGELDAVIVKSSKGQTYIRSRPDATKINNLENLAKSFEPKLNFNGFEMCWIENDVKIDCWPARSGREGYQSPVFQAEIGKGPIPEGEWYVRQDRYQRKPPIGANWIEDLKNAVGGGAWPGGESSWGRNRIWLIPKRLAFTFGRSGFSIHGGETLGSAGCIDLASSMPMFVMKFLSYGKNMILTVKY